MTTESQETSAAGGEPIELYRFSYGVGLAAALGYTDADFALTHGGLEYQPVAGLERQALTASQSLDKSEIEVAIDHQAEIAQLFLAYPPSDVVGLTIFRAHWDGAAMTTPVAIWIGRVLSCSRAGYRATLRCESAITSLRRVGLRRHYQYMCPHVLYGPDCGVLRALHTTPTQILSADARTAVVPGEIDAQYRGGMLSWQPVGLQPERRTILQITHEGGNSVLTLAGRPQNVSSGMAAELAKGCRHTLEDCRGVFDNAPNFGGQPYIPTQNPHGTTAIYN